MYDGVMPSQDHPVVAWVDCSHIEWFRGCDPKSLALSNRVFPVAGVFVVTMIINNYIRKDLGVLISLLTFGPRQVLLILVLSIFVAAAASFIPVKKIASKKPVDAIRNR